MDKRGSKKAQMTMFVILGLLVVITISLFFIFRNQINTTASRPQEKDIQSYIDSCVEENVNDAISKMLPQAGFVTPTNYVLYNNQKVEYTCYTKLNYRPCVNQVPLYITHLQDEITKYITPKVEECFLSFKSDLEKQDYIVEMKNMSLTTELTPKRIEIKINREVTIKKNQQTQKINNFNTIMPNALYDIAIVGQEITSQEAKFGYFEYVGFMSYYPWVKITKFVDSNDNKIYSIEDRDTKEKLTIAIRSNVLPGGF